MASRLSIKINQLLDQLKLAIEQIAKDPLVACSQLTDIIDQADTLSSLVPKNGLTILQSIQINAGDHLISAALQAAGPKHLNETAPLLEGKMHRISTLYTLGIYLHQHATCITITNQAHTSQTCLLAALKLAPQHPLTHALKQRLLYNAQ